MKESKGIVVVRQAYGLLVSYLEQEDLDIMAEALDRNRRRLINKVIESIHISIPIAGLGCSKSSVTMLGMPPPTDYWHIVTPIKSKRR